MQLGALSQTPAQSYTPPKPLQETTYLSHEKLDISYQDASGQSFNLSIERDVAYYSATYDSSGRTGTRPDSLKQDLKDALRDANGAAHGFRQLLHRLLKAVDKAYAASPAAQGKPAAATKATRGVEAAAQSVTVKMDNVDTDYWSVDKTAGRLKDFAVALYAGGDRQAHAEKMEKAMEEGYRQAAHALGAELPAIAQQTVDAAKKLLADWAQGTQKDTQAAPATARLLDLAA